MANVVFTAAATRQWAALPAKAQNQIAAKLTRFAQTGAGDVTKLQGREGSRLRVGDYRVLFSERDGQVIVVAVGRRRDVYD